MFLPQAVPSQFQAHWTPGVPTGPEEAEHGTPHLTLAYLYLQLEAGKVWGLTEDLQVLIEPGAQDGGDGLGRRWMVSKITCLALLAIFLSCPS
jgi:hypothetical protein